MIQEFFTKIKNEIGAAVLFAGNRLEDILFKIHFLRKINSIRQSVYTFTMEELILLIDQFPYALPESRKIELIEAIPVIKRRMGTYSIKSEIDLANWFRSHGSHVPKGVDLILTWDEIEDILGERERTIDSWSIFDVQEAVQKGLQWCLHSIRVSEDFKIGGLPAFWECSQNRLQPVGIQQAGTCNSDTLGALCESLFGPVEVDLAATKDAPLLLNTLFQYNLNCLKTPLREPPYGATLIKWNQGGFHPMEDQPASYHPTVDATANFVIASSISYFFFDELRKRGGLFSIRKDELGEAILLAVGFLLRTELEEGGWGIYRYPDDSYHVAPNPFSTALTVISLGLTKMCGVIDGLDRHELYGTINTALERALDFIFARKTIHRGFSVWTMAFDSETKRLPQVEILGATMFCIKALFSMSRGMPNLRARIYPIIREFLQSMDTLWEPDYEALYVYRFRVPLETQLNGSVNDWEIRLDVRLAALLLDFHNEALNNPELGIVISPKIRKNIEITIGRLLREQHPELGHWIDPISKRPFVVSTLFALEALQAYLVAVKNLFV